MKAICVDDEKLVLEETLQILDKIVAFSDTAGFTEPEKALEFLSGNEVDMAFLDINMTGISGIELAKRIKVLYPHTHIIFVTGYSDYAIDAFGVHACGYLLKPITEAAVREQLDYMGNIIPTVNIKRFRVQTFGNFEFFIDGNNVKFSCAKAKELLAYLVDRRGAAVSVGEAAAILFEDRKNETSAKSGVRNALSELNKVLRREKADRLIIKQRSTVALDTAQLDCDYYSLVAGDSSALNSYMGEYMAQYSWAEVTLAGISNKAL